MPFLLHPRCCIILSPPLFPTHFLICLFTIFSLFCSLHSTHSTSVFPTHQPFHTFSSLLTITCHISSFFLSALLLHSVQYYCHFSDFPCLATLLPLSTWPHRSVFSIHAVLFVLRYQVHWPWIRRYLSSLFLFSFWTLLRCKYEDLELQLKINKNIFSINRCPSQLPRAQGDLFKCHVLSDQILPFEKLEPKNVSLFLLEKWLQQLIDYQNSCQLSFLTLN